MPTTFVGKIGKEIEQSVYDLQPVCFQPILGCVPQIPLEIVKDLNTDQRYLYEIRKVVSTAVVTKKLSLLA